MVKFNKPIRLLVFDIDGVISDGEGQPLDLRLMERLAQMNRAARQNSLSPAVTLCTGRPGPYVEIMLQAIDGHLPAVYENGAGLYTPQPYRFLPHPAVDNNPTFQAATQRLEAGLVQTGRAFFQPGKQFSHSLFAYDPADTPALYGWAVEALGSLAGSVGLVYASSCLNVLPAGVDKGKGVEFLAAKTGYALAEMLGVGDSDSDLPFLVLTGYSAAPTNANPAVKQAVQYVSPYPTVEGVRDILDHFGLA
jgi:hydroxymethylpyrimidine pyrophosphatase-like HAD family hydrolase